MQYVRRWIGLAAVIFLALALNAVVWRQDPFSFVVLGPLGGAVIAGIIWLVLLFLALAARSTGEGRAVGGLNAVISSIVFFSICIVVYAFFQSWDASWDLTHEGRRKLSDQTVKVLQSLNREVKVTCFFINSDEELVSIGRDKTLRFINQCQKYTDLLKLEVLDPQIDKTRLDAMKITHASTQGTVVIASGAKQKVITLSGGSPRLEERDFTNALINVIRDAEPKVCFLTGHKERDMLDQDEKNGGSMLYNLLLGESYKAEKIGIKLSAPEVPGDCNILVINNPASDLMPQETAAIEAYLKRGGRLLILIDPWKQVVQGYSQKEELRPWLAKTCGIDIGSNIVITDKKQNIWQVELNADSSPFKDPNESPMDYHGCYSAAHPITRGFNEKMLFQACRTVTPVANPPAKVAVTELVRTPPEYWAESDVAKLAETGHAVKDSNEAEGPLSLAAAATFPADASDAAGRDARVVVVGDSDFAANGELPVAGHVNFVLDIFAWLSESEDLIAMRATGKTATAVILNANEQRFVAWVSILFTSQVVLAAGLVTLAVRRKNQ